MSLARIVVHTIPLQISISGTSANITCNDPRARIVEGALVFTFNPPNPKDPPARRRVCFVVADPPDADGNDNYFNMFSAPPLGKLVPWKRSGTTSRSPELPTGHKFDIVAIAHNIPWRDAQTTRAVARLPLEIIDGGGDSGDLF